MSEPLVCQSFVGTSIALGLGNKNQGHTQAAFGGAKRSEQKGAGPDASGAGYNVVPACPAKNRESGSSATGPEDPAGRGRNMILCWLAPLCCLHQAYLKDDTESTSNWRHKPSSRAGTGIDWIKRAGLRLGVIFLSFRRLGGKHWHMRLETVRAIEMSSCSSSTIGASPGRGNR